jgi:hypothetical protein
MLGGAAPIPASSGKTVRYRLNRSGNRQLNRALHNIALSRLRYDPDTQTYAQRRRSENKTDSDILRCLKRYIASRRRWARIASIPHERPTAVRGWRRSSSRPQIDTGPGRDAERAGPGERPHARTGCAEHPAGGSGSC